MADTLVAVTRGFQYPVGADVAAIERAGGLSKMSPAERATLRLKTVAKGGDCSDMPAKAAAHYLSRGDIARVGSED